MIGRRSRLALAPMLCAACGGESAGSGMRVDWMEANVPVADSAFALPGRCR